MKGLPTLVLFSGADEFVPASIDKQALMKVRGRRCMHAMRSRLDDLMAVCLIVLHCGSMCDD